MLHFIYHSVDSKAKHDYLFSYMFLL